MVSLGVRKPGGAVSFQCRAWFAGEPRAEPSALLPDTMSWHLGRQSRENQVGFGRELVLNVLRTNRLFAD